jgi:hypothetical protein
VPEDLPIGHFLWVTGIRRSGNHAIQLWLTGLFEHVIKFNYTFWLNPQKIEEIKAIYDPDIAVILGTEQHTNLVFHKPRLVIPNNTKQIIILRNILNNIASFAPFGGKALFETDVFLDLWASYADEFLGNTNILPDKVPVNFDSWFAEETYRRDLADRVGGTFSDSKLNEIDTNWGKSSFDRMEYQGRAQELKVLDRWRVFLEHPGFLKLVNSLKQHRAIDLYTQIYGNLPEELT